MHGFTKEEIRILKSINTPKKIQDFLDSLKINFEEGGETCLSPRKVLMLRKAHCFEGALLAAAALRVNGHRPLIVDLATAGDDQDHVIAVFKENGHWGAISKTNHYMLRYRDPVYKSIRELIISYFHEYYDDYGNKNLRAYTLPIDLSRYDKYGWMTSAEDVWYIYKDLFKLPHIMLVNKSQVARLRKSSRLEIDVGKLVEWKN